MIWGEGASWQPVKKAAPEVMKERREDMAAKVQPRPKMSNAESFENHFSSGSTRTM